MHVASNSEVYFWDSRRPSPSPLLVQLRRSPDDDCEQQGLGDKPEWLDQQHSDEHDCQQSKCAQQRECYYWDQQHNYDWYVGEQSRRQQPRQRYWRDLRDWDQQVNCLATPWASLLPPGQTRAEVARRTSTD